MPDAIARSGELLRDRRQDQRPPVGGREARGPLEEGTHDLAADGAGADDADAQGLNAHGWISHLGRWMWGRW